MTAGVVLAVAVAMGPAPPAPAAEATAQVMTSAVFNDPTGTVIG